MRRLAAASAMWLESAAFVRLRVSAMRTKRAREEMSGRMRLLQWGVLARGSIARQNPRAIRRENVAAKGRPRDRARAEADHRRARRRRAPRPGGPRAGRAN